MIITWHVYNELIFSGPKKLISFVLYCLLTTDIKFLGPEDLVVIKKKK